MVLEEVLAAHRAALMALPGVIGVAQGRCAGEPCISVFVADMAVLGRVNIPRRIEDFPVQIEVSSAFRARENGS